MEAAIPAVDRMADLLVPFYPELTDTLAANLARYLEVLLRWNAKTNLTAVREPEKIVVRHFGESLFASQHVPADAASLLDVGSGAGFPGFPIKLARPELAVTLAEAQGKKVAFLREICRVLQVEVEIWPGRAEHMPAARTFDCVTLRAVDDPGAALAAGRARLAAGGKLLRLGSVKDGGAGGVMIPGSHSRMLLVESSVPRGTQV